MTKGDANSWKKEFYNTAEQKAAQDGLTISLGTYKDLMDIIIKDFSPYDAPKDTIYEMEEMKMGNASIEEHVAKFKMLVTKKNEAEVEYFHCETRTRAIYNGKHMNLKITTYMSVFQIVEINHFFSRRKFQ